MVHPDKTPKVVTEVFIADEWNWAGPRGGPYRTRAAVRHGWVTSTPEDAQRVEAYLKWMTKRRYPDAGDDVIIFH